METAFYILALLGILGLFDVMYFHHHVCQLDEHTSSQVEVFVHFLRYPIYCFIFFYVANFRFHGMLALLPAVFYLADVIVAFVDVWIEPESRRHQGGLSSGESLLHFVFAILLGIFYFISFQVIYHDLDGANSIVFQPPKVHFAFWVAMNVGGFVCAFLAFHHLFMVKKKWAI